MPSIELKWPEGMELTRLVLVEDGWEATVLLYSKPDKWGNPIPTQVGWGFKQRMPQRAVDIAVSEAKKKFNSVLSLRNSRPDPKAPKLSPEDQLLQDLGL